MKLETILLMATLSIAAVNTGGVSNPPTDPSLETSPPSLVKVHTNRVTSVETDAFKQMGFTDCKFFRIYVTQYKYDDGKNIFYHIYQCTDDNYMASYQRTFFSDTLNGETKELPPGCPPPEIKPYKEKNPCKEGYRLGEMVSRLISNITIPQMIDPLNMGSPLVDQPELKEYLALREQFNSDDPSDFNDEQQSVIDKIETIIQKLVNGQITCFSEKVLPRKKVNIGIVCAKEGASKTIKDALDKVLKNEITCQHINCEAVELQLNAKKGGDKSILLDFESFDGAVSTIQEEMFQTGVPDSNGNYQIPVPSEEYGIFDKQPVIFAQADSDSLKLNECHVTAGKFVPEARVTFEKFGSDYIIRLGGKILTFNTDAAVNGKYLLQVDELYSNTVADPKRELKQVWEIFFHLGGKVGFRSAYDRTKYINQYFMLSSFNKQYEENGEKGKFYIRKTCPNFASTTIKGETVTIVHKDDDGENVEKNLS